MRVHIGEKVRQRMKELRIGPTELGKKIHTSKQNVNGMRNRRTIDSEMLARLSEALDFDFFSYYMQPEKFSASHDGSAAYGSKNYISLKKYQKLQMENYRLMKRVNSLLDLLEKKARKKGKKGKKN